MDHFKKKDIQAFITSIGVPLSQIFIDRGGCGDLVGYQLDDGREFNLVIESSVFEAEVINYLLYKGVQIRKVPKV